MWQRVRAFGKGWRTVILNGIACVSSIGSLVIATLASDAQDLNTILGQFITPTRAAVFVSGLTLLNVILRMDTTGPVGTKD